MEKPLLLASILGLGTSTFVLLGGGEDLLGLLTVGRARRAVSRTSQCLGSLGRTWLVRRLFEVAQVRGLVDELMGSGVVAALGSDPLAVTALVMVGAVLLVVAASLVFSSVVAGVSVGVFLVMFVVARHLAKEQRVRKEISTAMPGIYRTLSVALGSGQTLSQAVDYVGTRERGPAAAVFSRMSLRLRCGMSTEEAVGRLAGELGVSGADLLATALVISHRTGSPLRELLMSSARLAERQGEFERLLAVKTAQVRLSVKIVCLLPAVMVCLLAVISPDFQSGLLTPAGMGCLFLASVLDALALAIIRRLVRSVIA